MRRKYWPEELYLHHKITQHRCQTSPRGRAVKRRYDTSPRGRAVRQKYLASPKGKAKLAIYWRTRAARQVQLGAFIAIQQLSQLKVSSAA